MSAPTHPGIILNEQVVKAHEITKRTLAKKLGITRITLDRILKGESNLNPNVAWKLELLFGIPARDLLAQQMEYDLWKARQDTEKLESWPFPEQTNNGQLSLMMS